MEWRSVPSRTLLLSNSGSSKNGVIVNGLASSLQILHRASRQTVEIVLSGWRYAASPYSRMILVICGGEYLVPLPFFFKHSANFSFGFGIDQVDADRLPSEEIDKHRCIA
jgi:hypothetical protein